MSDLGGGSSDYSDDDLDDFVVRDDDSLRSAKRRRLSSRSNDRAQQSRRDDGGDSNTDGSGLYSDSYDGNDDRRNSRDPSPFYSKDDLGEQKFKYKTFVSKQSNMRENIFVTQLTQPPSPPEMIRGPRWKKEDPIPSPPPVIETVATEPQNRTSEQGQDCGDDEGLKAAIEASMRSFEEENQRDINHITSHSNGITTPHINDPEPAPTASAESADLFDDIPDDAFDSDLSLSPPKEMPRVPWAASQTRNRPLGVHQTTLFDMTTRNLATQPPRGEQLMAPPEKDSLDTWFNITQKGLFHNLLVALPTGLGKTFIAATVMLNWLRWTKDAQVIFVAPTKPLVAQQISACLQIAGIPRSQTTMLTGEASPGIRAEEWKTKRVFFMTPQTLTNDLKSGIADPKRIVLLVVDEAHRATGGYAYVEVVKFLRRFNQSFRVLALTATPGSTVESVQAVVDGLDIARVEIRTEQSLDIREYNNDEMVLCMDLLSSTLQPLVDQLRNLNAFWGRDAMSLTPFGLTKARQQWMMSDAGRNAHFGLKNKVNAIFTYHGITPLYRHLIHFQSNTDGKKGGKYQRQIVGDEHFKKLMNYLRPWTTNPEFIGHPKLEYLKQGAHAATSENQTATRVMIFVHFRDSAEEVTRVLKRYEPMIRPHVFGMGQKTQLDIVQKFKKGTYNTIVATSIGEEGLDIGEVDLIVCYDSSASPIRMLQRMGRTGRKRAEEENYLKAKDNYEKMQQLIASGTQFIGIKPAADKRHIDIPDENESADLPEPKKRKGRVPKKPPKQFHMPDNVETGFTTASSLTGTSKPKKKTPEKPKEKRKPLLPTPEPVAVPDIDDVLLTPSQQQELERHYQNIAGTSPEVIRFPRSDAFPQLQSVQRPIKIVRHGSLTTRVIGALHRMKQADASRDERYREVLAREENLAGRRSLTKHRERHIEPQILDEEIRDVDDFDTDEELPSASQMLADLAGPHRPKPFQPPRRVSDLFDFDDESDLPDPGAILAPDAERGASQKRRRIIKMADAQFDSALDLLRRLNPRDTKKNLSAITTIVPDLTEDLLSSVDQPLETRRCPKTKRDYLLCDYNRDGDSYRSPWSNEFDPPLDDGTVPSERVRRLEVAANEAFDVYRELYYEGGVGSVYFWDLDDGFAGVILLKKGVSPGGKHAGEWDSIHVFEATDRARMAHYKLTSTVILHLSNESEALGEMDLSGNMTRQVEVDLPVESDASHVANVGKLVEDMELKMRNLLQEVYFGKAKDVVGELRSKSICSIRDSR
ncbi:3'-5' DNA helicase [Aspergillus stella-maris]|uniref:3'-5' DNA helicase n=1 Tax=Aspergillus stella-maris TaxID=1810926 RepID=UPI003CCDC7AC